MSEIDKIMDQMNRETELLSVIHNAVVSDFVEENGKLNKDDLVAIVRGYIRWLSDEEAVFLCNKIISERVSK